jgi:predicted PurR-regulated permease PerM
VSEPLDRDRATVIDDGLAGVQRWAWRIIVIAAACVVLGWVVGKLWMVLLPVTLALIVSTVLGPPAAFLRSKGWPDALAAGSVVLGFIGLVVGLVAILTPQVAGQAPELADSASDGLQKVRDWLTDGPLDLSNGQIDRAIEAVQDRLKHSASAISSGVFSTIGAATSAVINLVLVLMLTFFFLKDGHKFLPWLKTLGGRRAGEHSVEVLSRAWGTLGGFIRTQTLVALIDAVIIGAFVSGALAVLVTLVTNSPRDALIAMLIVIGVQQLEGNVLSPYLQGKNLNLHAAVVLLSVTAGGTLFGVTGAFLAVPVAATTAEILRYVNERIDEAVGPLAPPEDDDGAEATA